MNPSEKVSSASPSPTNHSSYKARRQVPRRPVMHRSRSYSLSPPRPLSKQRSPRSRPRPVARRSRSRDERRRLSPVHHHRSSDADRIEEYVSICIKNLNEKIDYDHLYDSIYFEFKRYGQYTIKIVYNKKSGSHSRGERIAFVNFCDHRTALEAKRDKNHKMLCGMPMYIEPVYKNYSSGTMLSARRSRSPARNYQTRRSPSPRPLKPRARDHDRLKPERRYPVESNHKRHEGKYARSISPPAKARTPPPPARLKYDDLAYRLSPKRSPRPRQPPPLMKQCPVPVPNSAMHYYDDDEKDQTRTLFIGNLDADTNKDLLWKHFERYGPLEDIDIKKSLPAGQADFSKKTYAFVRFENMDMAKEAKIRMNGKRIGQSEIKIGYGKVQATNCLWIGGLRDSSNIKDLEKEIKYILNTNDSSKYDILYKSPDNFAFVLFYNVKHAEEVRFELRGKSLPRSEKLRIDFHDPKKFNLLQPKALSPRKSRSPSPKPKMTQSDNQQTQEEVGSESKAKKNKLTNGTEPKQNYENIIITKIDNVRRVDAISSKNRSRSRSNSPQVKKKRSVSPIETKIDKQSDKREFEIGKDKDEGEIEDIRPARQVIKSNWLLDESHVHLSRSVMTKSIKSVTDMKTLLEPYTNWSGQMTLKKNSFPVKFYLMAGNKSLGQSLLPVDNKDMNLQINQRIRLDSSKLDDIEKKLSEKFDQDESVTYSVYVCVASDLTKSDKSSLQKRPLHNLVSYLNQKCAAGVVNLPDDNRVHANLNIFTVSSNLSTKIFKQLLSGFRTEQLNEDKDNILICILLKASSA